MCKITVDSLDGRLRDCLKNETSASGKIWFTESKSANSGRVNSKGGPSVGFESGLPVLEKE